MKLRDSRKRETPISGVNSNGSPDLAALFDGHVAREFADCDVDATMETMVAEPYVLCVASLMGGFGGREVRRFYSGHFINQIPKDGKVTPISRTIGEDQVAWWDQASLLVQVGLLAPANLPVTGIEQARKLLSVADEREGQSTAATIG